jgi:hypothetical protein
MLLWKLLEYFKNFSVLKTYSLKKSFFNCRDYDLLWGIWIDYYNRSYLFYNILSRVVTLSSFKIGLYLSVNLNKSIHFCILCKLSNFYIN